MLACLSAPSGGRRRKGLHSYVRYAVLCSFGTWPLPFSIIWLRITHQSVWLQCGHARLNVCERVNNSAQVLPVPLTFRELSVCLLIRRKSSISSLSLLSCLGSYSIVSTLARARTCYAEALTRQSLMKRFILFLERSSGAWTCHRYRRKKRAICKAAVLVSTKRTTGTLAMLWGINCSKSCAGKRRRCRAYR